MTEKNYIRYRKLKAFGNKLCFILCRVFPVKKNRISVCTFEGKGGFGCNPRYIVEELHRRSPEYEFVWFVNDMNKEFPPYIKKVPNTLWSRAYWLSTSKVWIDNYRKPYGTCKRKGQYYVNTWHGAVGFKSIGLWRGEAFSKMAYLVSKNDSDMIDNVIVDSKWCEEVFPKGLVYSGPFLRYGSPRCDALYGDRSEYRENFRKKHGLKSGAKVVMFAPTFREGKVKGKRTVFSEVWSLDFQRLLHSLERRFGGEWYLCLRVHPQLVASVEEYKDEILQGRLIDVSREDDMYEILAGMDVFVTDYSSAAMDASYTHMPVFIYADDIEKYVNDRGSLFWDLPINYGMFAKSNKEIRPDMEVLLPYSISHNNDELEENIINFDEKQYLFLMKEFEDALGLIFDGEASVRAAGQVEGHMKE